MRHIIYCLSVCCLFACNHKPSCQKATFDQRIVDSVKQKTDTSYRRTYRTEEFAVADYFINRKDSTACQVMKDTGGTVRQVIMTNKGVRFYTAEYFENGQLKARLPFDKNGKFDGEAEYYFENGCVMRRGSFAHGFFHGNWQNFDEAGGLVSIDSYDGNGQLINSTRK